ncbi:RluA family pseudouridine synthase [Phycisphaerales bacterium AB-hyl4]|uniref:RluA family pseudouridine synthase n=1 Tax=Natronomicrosphaera hydrolytica TaxID=3242702 RepID=A0ABV4U491_9BACT
MARQQLQLESSDAGGRLDRVLARRLGLSRRAVWGLLREGGVQCDGQVMSLRDKGRAVSGGQRVMVGSAVPPGARRAIANPQLALKVAAAGRDWVIADKPSGMPVHPLEPSETRTLLNAVIARWPRLHGVGEGGLRSGVAHRLDVDTSGLVLLALTEGRWQQFRKAFAEHRIEKRYLALVHGRVGDDGEAVMDLAITQHRPARVRVVERGHADSRRCSLAWQVRERFADATLLEVELHTGFLHQIRVMLAHLGHAVVGDAVYAEVGAAAPRLMLHACRLAVDDQVRAQAEVPSAFAAVLGRAGA